MSDAPDEFPMPTGFTDEQLAADPILRFLIPNPNLPNHLKAIAGEFFGLTCTLLALLPRNAERTVAFRKLIEAKDCAVRAAL